MLKKSRVAVKLEENVNPFVLLLEATIMAKVTGAFTVCPTRLEENVTVEDPALNVPVVCVQFPCTLMVDVFNVNVPPFM